MSSFNKTEYHSNNPEQGVSVIQNVRDNKSHSNIYLKQVDKRNQAVAVADTNNNIPNKLKNKLSNNIPLQEKKSAVRKQVSLTQKDLQTHDADILNGETDAFAELELEYDVEGDAEEYEAEMERRILSQRLRVLEKETQYAKEESLQLQLLEDVGKDDFNRHSARVLLAQSVKTDSNSPETAYELYLKFENLNHEHEGRLANCDEYEVTENDVDIAEMLYEEECAEQRADQRLQDEIENRRAEAMEEDN
jgi:hypothetical protein